MRIAASTLLLCLLLARADAQDKKKPAEKKPVVVALTKVPVKKGMLRPGLDIKSEIPAQAYQAKIGSDLVLFVDLDANDQLAPGSDGLAMPSTGPFVVPLPEGLLLKSGQYKFTFDGMKQVSLATEDLGAHQKYVPEASLFTEIRLRAGLRTAVLDAQMCQDCDKHTDYMKLNKIIDVESARANPHLEDPSKPGYTAEGAAAGTGSNIHKGVAELRKSIGAWYTSVFHASNMFFPSTEKFGVTTKNSVGMMYVQPAPGFGDPYAHPPDGAVEVPTAFGNGEFPENPTPVPGTDGGLGCGFPVVVRLNGKYSDIESGEMVDGAGRPVKGTWSTPAKPAHPSIPENAGCVFFIPSRTLAAKTTYKVTIKFPGGDKPMTWSFTTGTK